MNGNVVMANFKSAWHLDFCPDRVWRNLNIKHCPAEVAHKMTVILHVRTEPRRAAVQIDQPNQTRLYQRIQAVVNCRHRDVRHLLLGPDEDLFGGGMVPVLQEHPVHVLSMWGKPKPTVRQPLVQAAVKRVTW
jgi:hypothetical protein